MKVRIEIPAKYLPETSATLSQDFLDSAKASSSIGAVSCTPSIVPRAVPRAPHRELKWAAELDIVVLLFEFAANVSAGVIANWLYGKLCERGAIIVVGKRDVRIENAEKLREVIIEQAMESNDE